LLKGPFFHGEILSGPAFAPGEAAAAASSVTACASGMPEGSFVHAEADRIWDLQRYVGFSGCPIIFESICGEDFLTVPCSIYSRMTTYISTYIYISLSLTLSLSLLSTPG